MIACCGPAAWRCAGPPFAQERAARIREIQIARRIVCVCPARLRGRRPAAGRSKSRYPGQQRAVVGTVSRARARRGVADTYTGCTLVDATDGTRAMDAWRDAWLPILVAHSTAGPRARCARPPVGGRVRRVIAYP